MFSREHIISELHRMKDEEEERRYSRYHNQCMARINDYNTEKSTEDSGDTNEGSATNDKKLGNIVQKTISQTLQHTLKVQTWTKEICDRQVNSLAAQSTELFDILKQSYNTK